MRQWYCYVLVTKLTKNYLAFKACMVKLCPSTFIFLVSRFCEYKANSLLLEIDDDLFDANLSQIGMNHWKLSTDSIVPIEWRVYMRNSKQLEMFYLNTIEQLFLFVEQLDQLEVCLPYSRLLTGIQILLVFQNLRWNSNKTSLLLSRWFFHLNFSFS